jgi:hypothetical protein
MHMQAVKGGIDEVDWESAWKEMLEGMDGVD